MVSPDTPAARVGEACWSFQTQTVKVNWGHFYVTFVVTERNDKRSTWLGNTSNLFNWMETILLLVMMSTQEQNFTGRLTSTYQNFLDANKIVESCEFSEEIQTIKKEKILEASKIQFGKFFRNVPPWS